MPAFKKIRGRKIRRQQTSLIRHRIRHKKDLAWSEIQAPCTDPAECSHSSGLIDAGVSWVFSSHKDL